MSRKLIRTAPTHLYPDPPGFKAFGGVVKEYGSDGKPMVFGFRSVSSKQVFLDYLEAQKKLRSANTIVLENDGIYLLTSPPPERPNDGSPTITIMDQRFGYQHPYVLVNVKDSWKPDTRSLEKLCKESRGSDFYTYISPSQVPISVRQAYVAKFMAEANVRQQQRDNEPESTWLARRLLYGAGSDFVDMLISDLDFITIKQTMPGPNSDASITVRVSPAPASELHRLITSLGSRQRPFVHRSDAIACVTTNFQVPKFISRLAFSQDNDSLRSSPNLLGILQEAMSGETFSSAIHLDVDSDEAAHLQARLKVNQVELSPNQIAKELGGAVNTNGVAQSPWKISGFQQTFSGTYGVSVSEGKVLAAATLGTQSVTMEPAINDDPGSKRLPLGTLLYATCDLSAFTRLEPDDPLYGVLTKLEKMYQQYEAGKIASGFGGFAPQPRSFRSILENLPPDEDYTAELSVYLDRGQLVIKGRCSSELIAQGYARRAFTNRAIYGR